MRRHIALSFLSAAILAGGCGDDFSSSGSDKVDADEQEMTLDPDGDGVAEAQGAGDLASMSFELSDPLPEVAGAEAEDSVFRSFDATEDFALGSIAEALEVQVSSPRTGVSVSLTADGMLVPAPPSAPGEWSVTLSDDRMNVSLQWYNQVASGASLTPGQTYDVIYSLGDNCCVSNVSERGLQLKIGG